MKHDQLNKQMQLFLRALWKSQCPYLSSKMFLMIENRIWDTIATKKGTLGLIQSVRNEIINNENVQ